MSKMKKFILVVKKRSYMIEKIATIKHWLLNTGFPQVGNCEEPAVSHLFLATIKIDGRDIWLYKKYDFLLSVGRQLIAHFSQVSYRILAHFTKRLLKISITKLLTLHCSLIISQYATLQSSRVSTKRLVVRASYLSAKIILLHCWRQK